MVAIFFLFKQKTAYEMRISDWSLDVCSSDLLKLHGKPAAEQPQRCIMRLVGAAANRVFQDDDPVAKIYGAECGRQHTNVGLAACQHKRIDIVLRHDRKSVV